LVEAKVDTDPRIYGGVHGPQVDIIGGHEQDGLDGSHYRLRMEVIDSTTGRGKTFWINPGDQAIWEIVQTGKSDPVVYVNVWESDFVLVRFDYDAYWDWIGTSEAAALMVYENVASQSPLGPVQTVLEDPPLVLKVMIQNDPSGWEPLFLSDISVDSTSGDILQLPPALITASDSLRASDPTGVKIVVSGGYNPYTREYVLDRIRRNDAWQPLWWVSGNLEGKFISPIKLSAMDNFPTVSVEYRSFILWERSGAARTRLVRPPPSTTRSATRPRRLRVPGGGGGRGGSPE
jgi:hypothetical protein